MSQKYITKSSKHFIQTLLLHGFTSVIWAIQPVHHFTGMNWIMRPSHVSVWFRPGMQDSADF